MDVAREEASLECPYARQAALTAPLSRSDDQPTRPQLVRSIELLFAFDEQSMLREDVSAVERSRERERFSCWRLRSL